MCRPIYPVLVGLWVTDNWYIAVNHKNDVCQWLCGDDIRLGKGDGNHHVALHSTPSCHLMYTCIYMSRINCSICCIGLRHIIQEHLVEVAIWIREFKSRKKGFKFTTGHSPLSFLKIDQLIVFLKFCDKFPVEWQILTDLKLHTGKSIRKIHFVWWNNKVYSRRSLNKMHNATCAVLDRNSLSTSSATL